MKLHGNARLTPKGRLVVCRRVVGEGWSLTAAAEAAGVSERTAGKWVGRYRAEGELALVDRSSAPDRVPGRTAEARVELIASLRRLRMTGAEIAECLGMACSTVSGILYRIGLGKLSRLEPPEPPNRYVRAAGRADPHRRQEARTDRPARRRHHSRAASRSLSVNASASLIRRPARQSTTTRPRSLSPSGV
jgi:transposase